MSEIHATFSPFTNSHGKYFFRFNKYNPDIGDTYVRVKEFNSSNMREQRHRGFGKCYTYHPSQDYRNYGIYYMKFTL